MNAARLVEVVSQKLYNPHSPKKLVAIFGTGVALAFGGTAILVDSPKGPVDCETNPLRHVYHPQRLQVQHKCVTETVTIVHVTRERDGDYHIQAIADPKWLTRYNYERQHGFLVLEQQPTDHWKPPKRGDILKVNGATHVLDLQHGTGTGCVKRDPAKCNGWSEFHPMGKKPTLVGRVPKGFFDVKPAPEPKGAP